MLAAGLPGDDLRRSGRKRGPTKRSEVVAVHHHEHPPVPVPSRRELLVRRKECLASRVRAPEVELAPRERGDGRETLRVERKHLEVVPLLQEKVVRFQNLERARRDRPRGDRARGTGQHDEEARDEREPGSGHPWNGVSLAPEGEEPRRNVDDESPEKRAEREEAELTVLEEYMPPPLSEAELEEIVDNVIAEVGATSIRDLGRVMADVMPQVSGRADGSVVSQLVREALA